MCLHADQQLKDLANDVVVKDVNDAWAGIADVGARKCVLCLLEQATAVCPGSAQCKLPGYHDHPVISALNACPACSFAGLQLAVKYDSDVTKDKQAGKVCLTDKCDQVGSYE